MSTTALMEWMSRMEDAIQRPEAIPVGAWAEKHLVLSEIFTNWYGPLQLDRTPYMRDPLEAFLDPASEDLTFCFASQVGKTLLLMLIIGYIIDQDPGPTLFVMPTDKLVEDFADQRLKFLINDNPILRRHRVRDEKKFTASEMTFQRMKLWLVGSGSAAELSSRSVRYLILDEVDKFPRMLRHEAGAVALAEKRVRTFKGRRKIIRASTPTTDDGSIWASFKLGDQRYYWVPCPHCGELQTLKAEQLRFPQEARSPAGEWDFDLVEDRTFYECAHCKSAILDKQKPAMLRGGEWRAARPGRRRRSWHLSALYSSWVSFGEFAVSFLSKKDEADELRDHMNSFEAMPWQLVGKEAKEDDILRHRGDYPIGTCPAEPLAVVLTADVQEHSIYCLVRGWGRFETSWLIAYGVLPDLSALAYVAGNVYQSPTGELRVTHAFIDSGYATDEVYKFCRQSGFTPVKGVDQQSQPIRWSAADDLPLMTLDASYFKDSLQHRLKIAPTDPGAWHLPADTDPAYARHLTAETLVKKRDPLKGTVKRFWKKSRSDNHWLDCEVYQLAAARAIGVRDMQPRKQKQGRSTLTTPDGRPYLITERQSS